MPIVRVNIPNSPHDFIIEPGGLDSLGQRVRAVAPHGRALLAVDQKIADTHGRTAMRSLGEAGYDVAEFRLRAEEPLKSLDSARAMYGAMLSARLDRQSPLIAMGGGIVGDTAGFAAATFMRGVPLIQIPTTLLAMVDASIGGKTGVNFELPGGHLGKNLIGVFQQPRLILADSRTLLTLNPRDFACGLAECIKHGLIADPGLVDFIVGNRDSILNRDVRVVSQLIERSARIKISIVERDERESGERALLNLGHTFAHAIESFPELQLQHGEAVAIGLLAACRCSHVMGLFAEAEADAVSSVIRICNLPDRLPGSIDTGVLMEAMRFDKKSLHGRLRLVLPVARGRCEVVENVPDDVIAAAWREVGAR
jgi:3-dehydroquinate synthase